MNSKRAALYAASVAFLTIKLAAVTVVGGIICLGMRRRKKESSRKTARKAESVMKSPA